MTPASDRTFEPISPNPFIVGNPVRDPAMFFGREAEFSLVRKRFGQSERGCLMVFCGERRSGKTSILLQIQQGRLGSDFVAVLIDMQAMAVGANRTTWRTREIRSGGPPGVATRLPVAQMDHLSRLRTVRRLEPHEVRATGHSPAGIVAAVPDHRVVARGKLFPNEPAHPPPRHVVHGELRFRG